MGTKHVIVAVVFVLVAAAFFYDRILGWRAMGVVEMAYGFWVIWVRRVPYGDPPRGYLTGMSAVVVGLIAVALGLFFVLAPKVVDDLLSNA